MHRFPVDKIKIDQSFIHRLGSGDNAATIVRAMVGLGHSLGIQTNAEGVETAEQLAVLREAGCDEVQGYYLGCPASAPEIAQELIRRSRRPVRAVLADGADTASSRPARVSEGR